MSTILSLLGLGPKKQPVQRLGPIATQTAKEGGARPIIFGRCRPIGGNIMHAQKPVIRRVKQKSSGGGKGGKKKQETVVENVFRSYAIRISEGPITAILRVWRNDKLVYDGRGNAWGAKNNGVFLRMARFYLGGWDQMPDPTLESIWGAGEVPAYRGTCYMVVQNENLTELGGAVPQYLFEVERAEGAYFTSRPYAVEDIQGVQAGPPEAEGAPYVPPDMLDAGQSIIVSGELRQLLMTYTDWPAESLDAGQSVVISGELRQLLKSYTDWPVESVDAGQSTIISGTLRVALITYDRWPVEALDAGQPQIIGGSLT